MEGLAIETEDEEVGARSEPTFLRILPKQNTDLLSNVSLCVCVSQV